MTAYDIRNIYLQRGSHAENSGNYCAMELAALIAKEKHSDQPECVCPVLTDFVITLNDSMESVDRQKLKTFIPRLINTKDSTLMEKRANLAYWYLMSSIMPFAVEYRLGRPDVLAKDVASRLRALSLYKAEIDKIDPENPKEIQSLFYRPLENDLSMNFVVEEAFYDYLSGALEYDFEPTGVAIGRVISLYSSDILSDLSEAKNPEDADAIATSLDNFWSLSLSVLDKLILDGKQSKQTPLF